MVYVNIALTILRDLKVIRYRIRFLLLVWTNKEDEFMLDVLLTQASSFYLWLSILTKAKQNPAY